MSAINRYIVNAAYLAWNSVNITDDYVSVKMDSKATLVDVTAGNDPDMSYKTGRRDNTWTIEFVDVGTATTASGGTVARIFYAGNSGTVEFAPQGTATGKPKYLGVMVVESVSTPYTSYNKITRSATLRLSGGWTSHYDISGSTY
jgi:Flp pilus assembly protein TadG